MRRDREPINPGYAYLFAIGLIVLVVVLFGYNMVEAFMDMGFQLSSILP